MDREQLRRIINDTEEYDEAKEDSLRSMLGDFYSRKMLWAIIFCAGAATSAMKFFHTDQTRDQIMYAAIFICLVQFIGLMKVFAWQMMARNSVKREVKRLELRIAELTQALTTK